MRPLNSLLRLLGLERRSLENPNSTLSDPDEWVFDDFGARRSASGVRVTTEVALSLHAVFRAVTLISGDVAKLPLYVYRRVDGGGKERDRTHPAHRVLRRSASPEIPSFHFRQSMTATTLLHGNSYAVIERDPAGRPIRLVQLPTGTHPDRVGGRLVYRTRTRENVERVLDPNDVLHIRGLGDGLAGKSVVRYAAESIGIAIAGDTTLGEFYSGGLQPSAVLSHPKSLSKDAVLNLKRSIKEAHSGEGKRRGVVLLQEGMTLSPWSISPEDAQILERAQFSLVEIANFFGIPPHKLGAQTNVSYASLEQENAAYLQEALDTWLCAWETECWTKLLSEEEKLRESHEVEFVREALVRTDLSGRSVAYQAAIGSGWMSPNEVRARENLPPRGDGLGDAYFVNAGVQSAAAVAAAPAPSDPAPRIRGAVEVPSHAVSTVVRDAQRRVIRRIGARARDAARTPQRFTEWLEGFRARSLGEAIAELRGAALLCAENPTTMAEELLDRAREMLDRALDAKPEELEATVRAIAERLDTLTENT